MTQLAFYLAAAVTLFSAIGVVSARNVVHAALFLLLSFAGVAGLFVLLYAEFLALVQILIYGGAVTIVILFALMLTKNEEFENQSDNRRRPFALAAALILFLFMAFAFVTDAEKFQSEKNLVKSGYKVFGGYRRSSTVNDWRLRTLKIENRIEFVEFDLLEFSNILRTIERIEPEMVFNLAAQSFVSTSFEQPIITSEINALGTIRILDAIPDKSLFSLVIFILKSVLK